VSDASERARLPGHLTMLLNAFRRTPAHPAAPGCQMARHRKVRHVRTDLSQQHLTHTCAVSRLTRRAHLSSSHRMGGWEGRLHS
jgi:hypothetical protein